MAEFNRALFEVIFRFSHRNFIFDYLSVSSAEYLTYFLVVAALVLFARAPQWRLRWFRIAEAALAVILSRGILTPLIRFFYDHPRPSELLGIAPLISEVSSSFPSGHAAFLFALAMAVFYVNRQWGIWFFSLAVLNGLARILVGVHWPLDIVGGAAVGIVSAMLVHLVLSRSAKELGEKTAV